MAIEFPCVQCATLLRVPDEAAGKHAKCAKCGAIMLTPDTSATQSGGGSGSNHPASNHPASNHPASNHPSAPTSATSSSPLTPLAPPTPLGSPSQTPQSPAPNTQAPLSHTQRPSSPGSGGNPLDLLKPQEGFAGGSSGSPAANPFAETAANPYQTPTTNPFVDSPGQAFQRQPPRDHARGRLMPVGIVMLLLGAGSLLFHGLAIIGAAEDMGNGRMNDDEVMGLVVVGFWIVWSLLILVSGVAMMRMKSLPTCWAGTVAALIPCTCCLFVAMPVGVWAAVVLTDPIVSEVVRGRA